MIYVNIRKKLGDFLLDVEFTCEKETLALFGESGCGKSITLKCIAGVETPDEGEIILNNRILFSSYKNINIPSRERKVGLLFQNYALFPNMTLLENIKIGFRDKSKIGEVIPRIIRDFSLDGLENNYPSQLSGGQQQRAALARMLVNEPDVLLLDEPFSALDAHLRWTMEKELKTIIKSYTGSVIYVSHNKNEVYRICDSVAVMNRGAIIENDMKSKIFNCPKKAYTANLLGYKNIMEAKILDNGKLYLEDLDISLKKTLLDDNISYVGIKESGISLVQDFGEDFYEFEIEDIMENFGDNFYILKIKDKEKRLYIKSPIDLEVGSKVGGVFNTDDILLLE